MIEQSLTVLGLGCVIALISFAAHFIRNRKPKNSYKPNSTLKVKGTGR
ncbi:hypothetical protein [Kiloniella laminariae]|nr:hypothetical protein [Kiloniella laminariae]